MAMAPRRLAFQPPRDWRIHFCSHAATPLAESRLAAWKTEREGAAPARFSRADAFTRNASAFPADNASLWITVDGFPVPSLGLSETNGPTSAPPRRQPGPRRP